MCKGSNQHAEELEKMAADLKVNSRETKNYLEIIKIKNVYFKVAEETLAKQEESRKVAEAEHAKLAEERKKLQEELEGARKSGGAIESEVIVSDWNCGKLAKCGKNKFDRGNESWTNSKKMQIDNE